MYSTKASLTKTRACEVQRWGWEVWGCEMFLALLWSRVYMMAFDTNWGDFNWDGLLHDAAPVSPICDWIPSWNVRVGVAGYVGGFTELSSEPLCPWFLCMSKTEQHESKGGISKCKQKGQTRLAFILKNDPSEKCSNKKYDWQSVQERPDPCCGSWLSFFGVCHSKRTFKHERKCVQNSEAEVYFQIKPRKMALI